MITLGTAKAALTQFARYLAQAVAFYASEDNAFMTDTTVAVNGGISMH